MDPVVKYKPARLFYDSYTPEEFDASLSPVIFVPGLGALHTSWNKVWKRIADQTRRKAFVIELRNHGKSEWNDILNLDALATDIENFMKERDLNQCCLVGHSLGGRVCLSLALAKPEIVDRLIVEEAPVADYNSEELNALKMMINMIRKFNPLLKTMDEKQIRSLISTQVANAFPEWGPVEAAYNIPLRKKSDGSICFDFNIDVLSKSAADDSSFNIDLQNCVKFSRPAMFVFSKGSPIKLAEDKKLREFFPNAKLQEFSGKVHVLHIECADEYVKNVSSFLNH